MARLVQPGISQARDYNSRLSYPGPGYHFRGTVTHAIRFIHFAPGCLAAAAGLRDPPEMN